MNSKTWENNTTQVTMVIVRPWAIHAFCKAKRGQKTWEEEIAG
jgi:hypothetical protein